MALEKGAAGSSFFRSDRWFSNPQAGHEFEQGLEVKTVHQGYAIQNDEIIAFPKQAKDEMSADLANAQRAQGKMIASPTVRTVISCVVHQLVRGGRSADDPTASCQGRAATSGVVDKRRKRRMPEEARYVSRVFQ